jgi:hypothetical protein
MAVSSAGFKPVRKPTWASEPVRPFKPVRKPAGASSGGLTRAQQNAQDTKNFGLIGGSSPGGLMQHEQDRRNAERFPLFAAAWAAATGAPAGGAPAPPPVPGAQGTGPINPFDAAGETAISARQKATQLALAALGGEKQQAFNEFFDPADPMSRQAELKRQFDQLANAQKYSQASSGQLYSGSSATEAALDERDRGFAQRRLSDQYQGIINGITERERQAKTDEADDILGITTQTDNAFAGNVENTPTGTGDTEGGARAAKKRTAAEMLKDNPALRAQVKKKLLAKRGK